MTVMPPTILHPPGSVGDAAPPTGPDVVKVTTFRVTRWTQGNVPSELDKVGELSLALGQACLVDKQAVIRIDEIARVSATRPGSAGTPGLQREEVASLIREVLTFYNGKSVQVLREDSQRQGPVPGAPPHTVLTALGREECLMRLILARLSIL